MIYYTLEYRELTYRNGDPSGYHYWCFGESFEKEWLEKQAGKLDLALLDETDHKNDYKNGFVIREHNVVQEEKIDLKVLEQIKRHIIDMNRMR